MTWTSKIQFLAAVGLLTVFIINILTPPAFLIDVLYLCSIVLVFKQNTQTIVIFSAAACVLIIINALFFDFAIKGDISQWINRGISLFAILITSYIAIHYRKQTQAAMLKEHQYLTALEEMLFMTSHQVRRPVANILGLIEAANTNGSNLSADDLKQLLRHLQFSADELDNFIKELNTFIEQTEEQHNQLTIQDTSATW
jgi:signal transduction histidine kinase